MSIPGLAAIERTIYAEKSVEPSTGLVVLAIREYGVRVYSQSCDALRISKDVFLTSESSPALYFDLWPPMLDLISVEQTSVKITPQARSHAIVKSSILITIVVHTGAFNLVSLEPLTDQATSSTRRSRTCRTESWHFFKTGLVYRSIAENLKTEEQPSYSLYSCPICLQCC